MYLKGLHFSEVEISSKKYIKEMENFGEEKEIIISCKWALKHCHFSCHVMTGFAYCRLLHIQFYFFFLSLKLYPNTDIVIITSVMLTAVEVFSPECS